MTRGRDYFQFKQFTVHQRRDVMRVNTDGVLLGAWTPDVAGRRILEVGTGTGVIALQLLQRGAQWVDAIDIDLETCLQARENAALSPWASQIEVVHSPFQLFAETCDEPYDLVVSNPPYYVDSLPSPNARRNQMRHALSLPTEDLLGGLELSLSPSGRFVAVFPLAEGSAFVSQAAGVGLYCSRQVAVADKPQGATKRLLCEFRRERCTPLVEELFIHNADGDYSAEYRALTAPFYLDF